VLLMIPKFARECAAMWCELRNRSTRIIELLVQLSENEGLIFAQAASGFAAMVHRKGFAIVALK
jgi:hypothetical protein